jgi:hypothetical protein
MRCDEISENLRICSTCRKELEELDQTRKFLRQWEDEPPLKSAAISPKRTPFLRAAGWKYLRYAAIAAAFLMAFMALANTQVTWNKEEFSISMRLLPRELSDKDYYTKAELRSLLKQAFDDSEYRMTETNYLMMQKMLDMVEQDRWMDLRLIRAQIAQNRNTN